MTAAQHAVLAAWCLLVGSCVGSFVNVCAHRLPLGLGLARPRSRCPRCGSAIRARDNVPVLGWLLRRGRCRACRGAIAIRYPAVELAVGLLYASAYLLLAARWAGDPWEALGAVGVLARLLAAWALLAAIVAAALMAYDARRGHDRTGPRPRSREGRSIEHINGSCNDRSKPDRPDRRPSGASRFE